MTQQGAPPAREQAGGSDDNRLLGLELGRYLAALLVALFHFSYGFLHLRGEAGYLLLFRAGHCGVDYFFVLSGFIIYHVHCRDIGVAGRTRPFAIKRFLRIYPIYWAIFALALAGMAAMGQGVTGSAGPLRALDALLLPFGGEPVIGQSWTLRHEIVFYAIFALVIAAPRLGWPIFAAWQIASMAYGVLHAGAVPWQLSPLLHVYNVGFAAGLFAGWLHQRLGRGGRGWLLLAGTLCTIALMAWEAAIGQAVPPERWPLGEVASPLLYIAAALPLVVGLAGWRAEWLSRHARLVGWLGGCSYVLYLIHNLAMSAGLRIVRIAPLDRLPSLAIFAALVLGTTAAAIIVHLWVEKPLLAVLRGRLLGPATGTARS